jgi:hypothetical protein
MRSGLQGQTIGLFISLFGTGRRKDKGEKLMIDEQRVKKDLMEILRALGEAHRDKRRLTQDDLIALMSCAEDGLVALGDRPASGTGTNYSLG